MTAYNSYINETSSNANVSTLGGHVIQISINRQFTEKLSNGDNRWSQFNNTFETMELNARGLLAEIRKGHAFTSPHRQERHALPGGKSSAYRHERNWINSQHLALDHDGVGAAMDELIQDDFISQYAAFIYTTVSHTEQNPRARTVFFLDYMIDVKAKYAAAAAALHWRFQDVADSSCKNVSRTFFGSKDCQGRYMGSILPNHVLDSLIEEFDAAMEVAHQRRPHRYTDFAPSAHELTEINEALMCIPKDLDYSEWLRIGMAIHNEFPTDEGCYLWERWSPGYPGECGNKWTSFNQNGNDSGQVTLGTLFRIAKEYGYQGARRETTWGLRYDSLSAPQINSNGYSEPSPAVTSGEESSRISGQDESHPLLKPYRPVDLGLIDEYVQLMHELTGAPREFHQLVGFTVLASVLHNAAIPVPWAANTGLRPNIFGCIVSPTSLFNKTTALRKAHDVLDYEKLPDCARLPVQFTEEGLIASLSVAPSGLIVRDEISGLFGAHRKRHLETVPLFLTQIYDGDNYGKQLSAGRAEISNPYVNIIGATTPSGFYTAVRDIDWEDGFMVRWLYVLPDSEPDLEYCPPLFTSAHRARINDIRDKLTAIHKMPMGLFNFARPDDYINVFHQWYRGCMQEVYTSESSEREAAIVKRYCTYALKFALLLSVGRGREWGTIPTDCLLDGIQLADNYKQYVYRLLMNQLEERIDGGKIQVVFRIIRDWASLYCKNGGNPFPTRREVGQYSHLRASVRDKCIDRLLETGAISEVISGRATVLVPQTEKLSIGSIRGSFS